METDPHRWIRALRRSQDSLDVMVASLGSEHLAARSYCADWTVAQALSHLGSGAEILQMALDATLDGEAAPDRGGFAAVWARWNQISPHQQASDAVDANERLVSSLEALEDNELTGFHVELFGMDLDAANFVATRLSEHAVHTWDVAVTLDPTARVLPAAVELLIDRVPALVERVAQPARSGVGPARLQVHTTEPERSLVLEFGNDMARLLPVGEGATAGVDGTIDLPAEALLRLAYGRLDAAHTPAALTVTGDRVNLDALRAMFPGF